MMTRLALLASLFVLSACPSSTTKDAGIELDSGFNVDPIDACSMGCAPNQKCDVATRTCRDGCEGNCLGGTICVAIDRDAGAFECADVATSCGAQVCQGGEAACLGGKCACLEAAHGALDTCFGSPYEVGAGSRCSSSSGKCQAPKKYQQCKARGTSCERGTACIPVFGDGQTAGVCDLGDYCVCTQLCLEDDQCGVGETCMSRGSCTKNDLPTGDSCRRSTDCKSGEICRLSQGPCVPSGILGGFECAVRIPLDGGVAIDAGTDAGTNDMDGGADGGVDAGPGNSDGGIRYAERLVRVSERCGLRDIYGDIIEDVPTGTCTYAMVDFAELDILVFPTCRPPGTAAENAACSLDTAASAKATQCSSGLECALMQSDTTGVCLRTCNGVTPGITVPNPQPACGVNEACLNLYHREDTRPDGALLGVCAPKCNVFDAAKSVCPNFGAFPAVCVPVPADGRETVSRDGSGLCLPLRAQTGTLGGACAASDAFKGAACKNGQVCAPSTVSQPATCTQLCDVTCAVSNPPARCSTQVNSLCPSGKTCQRATPSDSSRLGLCR